MVDVHIEGMGITGCLLAAYLTERHALPVSLSWHDTDAKYTAWKACTGAVYPSGDDNDEWARREWLGMCRNGFATPWLEEAAYWYSQKTPPHGSKHQPALSVGNLKLSPVHSVHLNAQGFVTDMRLRLSRLELDGGYKAQHVIVAHGFGDRLDHYYWGWNRYVKLKYDKRIRSACQKLRPCFYFREARLFFYAYPVPNTDLWYAGSNLLWQDIGKEKSYAVEPKYQTWKRHFEAIADGLVEVTGEFEMAEGWRPAESKATDGTLAVGRYWQRDSRVHVLPPLWNSGVRQFPLVWDALDLRSWL